MNISDNKKKALILDWLTKKGHLTCKVSDDGFVRVFCDFILREVQEGENVGDELSVEPEIQKLLV